MGRSGRLAHQRRLFGVLGLVLLWGPESAGQTARRFVARLSTVPITVAMQDAVSGRGSATATLEGRSLSVEGTFTGLRSAATNARLHLAAKALRGPAIADLVVSKGTSGRITGTVTLTDQQRGALDEGSLYIQLQSEKAPEGNLWGWFLPEEKR